MNKNFITEVVSFLSVLLLILVVIIFPQKQISAEWTKYNNNPILSTKKQSSWFINHILNPYIIKDNDKYNLWFTGDVRFGGHWNIGYGSSQNGIENWTINSNPVLSPSGDWETDINFISISKEESLYKTWYNSNKLAWQSGSDRYRLGYATSSSGISWNKYGHVLKGGPDSNSWDIGGLDRGLSILLINDTYHLWYTGANSNHVETDPYWRIGYATSPDGINWTKQNNGNPVIEPTESWELKNVSYPFVLHEDGIYKMWYATGNADSPTRYVYATSTDGIHWGKPADKNPVLDATGISGDFDSTNLSGFFILHDENMYKMWYSGFNGSRWTIGYATSSAEVIPPTPTPTPFEPVVVVPGIASSFNMHAIVFGQKNPTSAWTLLPIVKEYKGIINTLKNLGYEEGKNLFLWTYDWRKPIQTIAQNLNQFIDTTVKPTNPDRKIHLVGHSLGGLVSRTWTQTNTNKDAVHHLVTVGAPHKGTIQSYATWEAGEVWFTNPITRLLMTIAIQVNRRSFATTRELVQDTYPVLRDLLPIEPYLKRPNGTFVEKSQMKTWNTWLETANTSASSVYPILDAIQGSGFSNTPFLHVVSPPSWLDIELGNWVDGKPTSTEYADGDEMIPLARASFSDDPSFTITQNHGNVIASKEGVKTILDRLEIPYAEEKLSTGEITQLFPGLVFIMRSPATFTVTHNGQTYSDTDGFLFIPNASAGSYTVTVTGTGTGLYHLDIGQFTQTKTVWAAYSETTKPGLEKTYQLSFDATSPKADPITNRTPKEYLEDIERQLQTLDINPFRPFVIKARMDLKSAQKALERKQYKLVKVYLEQILLDLSFVRTMNHKHTDLIQKTLAPVDSVVNAYQAILQGKQVGIDTKLLSRMTTMVNSQEEKIGKNLEKQANKKKNIKRNALLYSEALAYKKQASEAPTDELPRRYILLFQSSLLFTESR